VSEAAASCQLVVPSWQLVSAAADWSDDELQPSQSSLPVTVWPCC